MIEDLDGAQPGPDRRAHVRIASVALVAAVFVGWAAASSPVFQGPFATPRPISHGGAVIMEPRILGSEIATQRTWCQIAAGPITVNAFVADHPVTIERVPPPPANPCGVWRLARPFDVDGIAP